MFNKHALCIYEIIIQTVKQGISHISWIINNQCKVDTDDIGEFYIEITFRFVLFLSLIFLKLCLIVCTTVSYNSALLQPL